MPESNPELPPAPELEVESQFLVHYTLAGLALIQAADERSASRTVFKQLNSLLHKAGFEGVSAAEAELLRLPGLQIDVDSAEAIEFPIDEPT